MDKLKIAKSATSFCASAATAKVVKEMITNNVTVETKIDKIVVWTATAVIVGMTKDRTRATVNANIDKAVAFVEQIQGKTKEETPEVTV